MCDSGTIWLKGSRGVEAEAAQYENYSSGGQRENLLSCVILTVLSTMGRDESKRLRRASVRGPLGVLLVPGSARSILRTVPLLSFTLSSDEVHACCRLSSFEFRRRRVREAIPAAGP
jgi:hypothetical protein